MQRVQGRNQAAARIPPKPPLFTAAEALINIGLYHQNPDVTERAADFWTRTVGKNRRNC